MLERYFHPESTDPRSFEQLALFFVIFLAIDFVASALAFLLERREAGRGEDFQLLLHLWLQRFSYRQLFSAVLFRTLKRAIDGKSFAWDKLERTAAVSKNRARGPSSQHQSLKDAKAGHATPIIPAAVKQTRACISA